MPVWEFFCGQIPKEGGPALFWILRLEVQYE
jgi:hypothetical protein